MIIYCYYGENIVFNIEIQVNDTLFKLKKHIISNLSSFDIKTIESNLRILYGFPTQTITGTCRTTRPLDWKPRHCSALSRTTFPSFGLDCLLRGRSLLSINTPNQRFLFR